LSGTVAAGGGFQFVMSGPAGSNYLIQASSDLVVWTTIATNFIPAGGSIPITDWSMTNYTRRFYRALAIAVSPPELTGMTVVPGTARFVLNGQTGSVCVIQASSNLLDWSAISTNTIPDPGSMPVTDLDAGNQAGRFYRAVRQ
jgi:hypothetical protein